jgi:hypothetical protein
MKKVYIIPQTEEIVITNGITLLGVSSDKGIGYGGKDANGTKDPSARPYGWDDEEDDWDDEEDE